MTVGISKNGNLAVCRRGDAVWAAVEVAGDYYNVVALGELDDDEYERVVALCEEAEIKDAE